MQTDNEKKPRKARTASAPKAEPAPHVEDIDHEVVAENGTPAPVDIDQDIKKELAKYSLPDAKISELKKQYTGLTIKGLEDSKGYELVRQARATVRTLRTGIESKRKELKADYIRIGRAIDEEASRLTSLLTEIEQPLADQLKKIDDEKEKIKREKEEAEAARVQGRVAKLLEAGIKFNGSFYSIGETVSIDVVTLKQMADAEFDRLVERVQLENKKILDAEAEAKRKEQEERDALQKQKEEQEAAQKRLEDERAAMEKEKAEMKAQRTQLRGQALVGLGFKVTERNGMETFAFSVLGIAPPILISARDFEDMDGEQWADFLDKATEQVKQIKDEREKLDQQEAEKEKRKAERIKNLTDRGLELSPGEMFFLRRPAGNTPFFDLSEVLKEPEEEFLTRLQYIERQVREFRDEDRKAEEAKIRKAQRVGFLEAAGFKYNEAAGEYIKFSRHQSGKPISFPVHPLESFTDEEWGVSMAELATQVGEQANADKAEDKRLADIAEVKRIATLSDVERVNEWLAKFGDAVKFRPKIESLPISEAFDAFDTEVCIATQKLTKFLDTYKVSETEQATA